MEKKSRIVYMTILLSFPLLLSTIVLHAHARHDDWKDDGWKDDGWKDDGWKDDGWKDDDGKGDDDKGHDGKGDARPEIKYLGRSRTNGDLITFRYQLTSGKPALKQWEISSPCFTKDRIVSVSEKYSLNPAKNITY